MSISFYQSTSTFYELNPEGKTELLSGWTYSLIILHASFSDFHSLSPKGVTIIQDVLSAHFVIIPGNSDVWESVKIPNVSSREKKT